MFFKAEAVLNSPYTLLFIPGKPSDEQAQKRMILSVNLVYWCKSALALTYQELMNVIGHKYEPAYHLD